MSFIKVEGKTKEEVDEKLKKLTGFEIKNSDGIITKYYIDWDEYERQRKFYEELHGKKGL